MSGLTQYPASTLSEIYFLTVPSMLLGNMLGYVLLGALLVQVYLYHIHFPSDQKSIKCTVYGLSLLDIVIVVLSTIVGWAALFASRGDFSMLTWLKWSLAILPGLTGFTSSCSHLFFCWRIWVLRRLYILPGCILTVSMAAWGVATFCGVYGYQLSINKLHVLNPFVIIWLGGSCLCNILITGTMVYILFGPQSKSAFKKTTGVAQNVVRLIVETGMSTCIVTLAEIILFATCPQNYAYLIPFFVISTIYANTLLATLNSRSLLPAPPHYARKLSLNLWDNRPPTPAYLAGARSGHGDSLDLYSVEDQSSFTDVPLKDGRSPSHSHSQLPGAYFPA